MKTKIFFLVLTVLLSAVLYSQDNGWRFLNHESGGYVTSIIPVKYSSGQQPSSLSGQVLYARTDVGGIYRSGNNGLRWDFNSCYYRTPPGRNFAEVTASEFHIQGLALRFNNRDGSGVEHDAVVVATGHYFEDAQGVSFKTIWRSNDNGNTGTFTQATINGSPGGIWFKGNDFLCKIGGECIVYDPNNINGGNSVMWAGGFYPSQSGGACYLYKSIDDGTSWNIWSSFPSGTYSNEGIICISMKAGSNHIWVGTTHRIVYSPDNGVTWYTRNIGSISTPYVKRIILQGSGSNITAYATWGNWSNTGICKFPSGSYTYTDLTGNFGTGGSGLFSSLAFVDDAESIIIAGKYENPLKTSADGGSSWSSDIQLQYTSGYSSGDPNYHNFPNHQDNIELSAYMYDGLSNITRNPNGTLISGAGNQWYLSGGAGPRKTAPNHGVVSNNFANSKWQYTVKGQTMPVMYDVVFHNLRFNNVDKPTIYMPMSDWTLSWEYNQNINPTPPDWLIPSPLQYDRKATEMCNFDTYISNVTRILFNPDDPNLAYCVGGSVYDYSSLPPPCNQNRFAGFYQRRDVDGSGTNFIRVRKESSPFLNISNRAIVDALMYKTPGNANRIIALVGQSSGQVPPNGSSLGIFYSDNGGDSWNAGTFDEPSGDASISTEDAYFGSQLPALINGTLGDLFDGHFTLGHVGNSILCLWLEQAGSNTGGIFISLNNGNSWSRQNVPSQLTSGAYLGPGSIKSLGSNRIALVVRKGSGNNAGIYTGTVNTVNGSISWDNGGNSRWNFISGEHLDVVNGKWAVYGRRSGDNEDQLYKSLDDGNSWSRIPSGYPLPLFARVNALRIRPNSSELWIATSGQGVFIHRQFQPTDNPAPWIITQNTTINYTDYIDQDIIVTNGAVLTFDGSAGSFAFDMGPGRKIEVQEGSSINCNNVTFGCPLGLWQGIKLYNAYPCQFTNCNINNAILPVEISNWVAGYSYYMKRFDNCDFNLLTNGTYCLSGYEVSNIIVNNCDFNMTGNQNSYGMYFTTAGDGLGGASGLPMGPAPITIVHSNRFFDGYGDIYINNQLAGFSNYQITGNTFNKNISGSNFGMFANNIQGNFKYNIFNATSFSNNLVVYNSTLNIFGNRFNANQNNNIVMDVNSNIQAGPVITEDGSVIWYGGQNRFNMYNSSSSGGNVNFTEGCIFNADKGKNCFMLQVASGNYHVSGALPQPCDDGSYLIRQNNWNTGPNFNITCGGSPYTVDHSISYTCPIEEELFDGTPSGYQVTDLGNGFYDTVYITTGSGSGGKTSEYPDKVLFASALFKKSNKDYNGAINNLKELISNHDSSKFLLPAIDHLFNCYRLSDTIQNQNIINTLYTDFNGYISEKMQQYSNRISFVDKSYRYYLSSLSRMKQFTEAISGYENIMQNHSNAITRLTASWDRSAAVLLMSGSGGGENSESSEIISEEKLMALFDKKPVHKIAYDCYLLEKTKTETENKFSNEDAKVKIKTDADKKTGYSKTQLQEVERRIFKFNPSTRPEHVQKIQDDMKTLLGLNKNNINGNNNIPLVFNLYQNYPNPFNPITTIKYDLPKDVRVNIKIYDILGKEVANIVKNEFMKAGTHNVEWSAYNYASGVYFYRIEAGDFVQSKKMVLVK